MKNRPKTTDGLPHGEFPTIFDTMLNPDSEKGQYTPSNDDLTSDAFLMFGAGTDTTGNALVQGTWYILSTPGVLEKLQNELRRAMPNKDDVLDWATLENLPYLVSTTFAFLEQGSDTHSALLSKKAFDYHTEFPEGFPGSSRAQALNSAVKTFQQGYDNYSISLRLILC